MAQSILPDELVRALADRYRLMRAIGTGGMASVYLAEDLRHGREVAIKVLKPEIAAQIGSDRFLSEIRTTARLQHPSILPLFDSGEADGLLFFVMPFVPGGTLRGRLDGGRAFSTESAVRLVAEVADALEYAHRQDIVHRDIKPENVLLHEDRPLLADFGIALHRADPGDTRLTQAGVAIGTRGYMSPEQLSGASVIDGRTDQYSLACVLEEMLARDATVDPQLEEVIRRATAHDPRHRFESMAAFASALREIGTAGVLDASPSIAVLAFENRSGERENDYFAEGMSEEIIHLLSRIPGLHVVARTSSFAFKGVREDLRTIGERLRVRHLLDGSVRKSGNRLRISVELVDTGSGFQLWSERYDRTFEDVFAIQDEIAATIAGKLELTLRETPGGTPIEPRTRSLAAYDAYLKGTAAMHRRGAGTLDAIDAFRQAIALDPQFAQALAGLSHALVLSSFWGMTDPRDVGQPALEAARRAREADPTSADAEVSSALVALSVEFDRKGAASAWERAIALAPADGNVRAMRAVFHHCYVIGDTDTAVRELRLALERDPLSHILHAHLGLVLSFGGRADEAMIEAAKAMELDPQALYGHWIAIMVRLDAGHFAEAIDIASKAVARFGRHAWLLMGLTVAHAGLGHLEAATAIHDELLARSRTEYVQSGVLSIMAMAIGRRDEAVARWSRAVDERDPMMVPLLLRTPLAAPLREQPEHRALLVRLGWDRPLH
jgi:TolB-like protein/tetratricopeptide (TPR) repeat protein/tRNA A-37 threonylcarbamoyl transferase component Bud32